MSSPPLEKIAIGDIHGCIKTLEALLHRLVGVFGDSREYIFLGDYVDRGPDSKAVVDMLLDFSKTHPCVFLRGNHDAMFMNSYSKRDLLDWFDYGGDATMESYQKGDPDTKIPTHHLQFFADTRLYYDTPNWLFVHGGMPPHQTISEALEDESQYSSFLWRRDHIVEEDNIWEKTVVFGHTPTRTPLVGKNMIGIDTGCVYPHFGKLTALLLPEMEFIQQQRLDF